MFWIEVLGIGALGHPGLEIIGIQGETGVSLQGASLSDLGLVLLPEDFALVEADGDRLGHGTAGDLAEKDFPKELGLGFV